MAISIMNNQDNQHSCRGCSQVIDDIVVAMRYGCPACGSQKFSSRTLRKQSQIQPPTAFPISDEASIRVSGPGKYNINLKALADRKTATDPIVIVDKKGIMNIVINPDDE
jgi:predicted  nucleic acid-binding Zn-ribbon protein